MQRREQLPAFQQILDEVRTITDDDQWKTYWLLSAGMDCSENRRHCPQTTRLLKQIPGASTAFRSEEHTSELQSLLRLSYAVFCLKIKNKILVRGKIVLTILSTNRMTARICRRYTH